MSPASPLAELSKQVATQLAQNDTRLVLAESCTAGLISASLATVPGISKYLCGSAVVYREQTKIDWLDVRPETLKVATAVSPEATDEITRGVLQKTTEAHWALGVTGHLGPGSPPDLDGQIYVACYRRIGQDLQAIRSIGHRLNSTTRVDRLREATAYALKFFLTYS